MESMRKHFLNGPVLMAKFQTTMDKIYRCPAWIDIFSQGKLIQLPWLQAWLYVHKLYDSVYIVISSIHVATAIVEYYEESKKMECSMRAWSLLFSCAYSVSVFPFTLVKLGSKLAMPAGNCTVWNMEFNLMDKCPRTRPLELATIHSTLSLARRDLENMFLGLCLSTWNQLLSVCPL